MWSREWLVMLALLGELITGGLPRQLAKSLPDRGCIAIGSRDHRYQASFLGRAEGLLCTCLAAAVGFILF